MRTHLFSASFFRAVVLCNTGHSPCGFPNPTLEVTEQFWNVVCLSKQAADPSLDIVGPSCYRSCQQLSAILLTFKVQTQPSAIFSPCYFSCRLVDPFPVLGTWRAYAESQKHLHKRTVPRKQDTALIYEVWRHNRIVCKLHKYVDAT